MTIANIRVQYTKNLQSVYKSNTMANEYSDTIKGTQIECLSDIL